MTILFSTIHPCKKKYASGNQVIKPAGLML